MSNIKGKTKKCSHGRDKSEKVAEYDGSGPAGKVGFHCVCKSLHSMAPHPAPQWMLGNRFRNPIKRGKILEPASHQRRNPEDHAGQRRVDNGAGSQWMKSFVNILGARNGQVRALKNQDPKLRER